MQASSGLIRKWINVGVIDEGKLLVSETGTGQGQIISPLLANVYLHHVLDVWLQGEVKPRLKGRVVEVRYADDAVLCFSTVRMRRGCYACYPRGLRSSG